MSRYIHTIALTAVVVIAVMAAEASSTAESEEGISIVRVKEPLTAKEVTSAIALLGLRYDRYEFESNEKKRLSFTIDEYLNGRKRKSYYSGTLSLKAGQFVLTILDDRRKKDTLDITYTLRNETADSVRSGSLTLFDSEGYFISKKAYAPTVAEGEKSLLCVWAGKRRIKGACLSIRFSGNQSLQDTVSENDLVLALFVEVESNPGK